MYRKLVLPFLMLWALVCWGCTTLHEASSAGDLEQVDFLLANGSDINERDKNNMTPLMLAAQFNEPETVRSLLTRGATTGLKNRYGQAAIEIAWEHGSVEAFKVLMEYGAAVDFRMNDTGASAPQKKIRELVREYQVYQKLAQNAGRYPLRPFDIYFSKFSNGFYYPEVGKLFQEKIRTDYEQLGASPAPEKLDQFIRDYSTMGKHVYLVNASSLNIRREDSVGATRLGSYQRGDTIYAISARNGWIQTDRGWVSREYLKPVSKVIPGVQPYLAKARNLLKEHRPVSPAALAPEEDPFPPPPSEEKISRTDPPAEKQAPAPLPSPEKPESASVPEKQTIPARSRQAPGDARTANVRQELEALMARPTLPALEAFILRYEGDAACGTLVQAARDKYKEILFGQ